MTEFSDQRCASRYARRSVLQAGAWGMLGGTVAGWRRAVAEQGAPPAGKDVIWDLHCHLSGVPGNTPLERMGQLLTYADRLGIERLCVYMGMPWSRQPTPDDLRRENDQVLEVLQRYPDRVFGFTYVSGRHVEASLSEMNRCIDQGPMVGIKLWIDTPCDGPGLDAIIERAASLQAAIFQHTWFRTDGSAAREAPGESTPDHLVALARRHPGVPLICGHTGGTWELGIRAIRAIPTISIDLAGSDPTSGLVEMALRELGPERIIYGSDAGGRSFASQLAKVYSADLSAADRQRILSGNLRRLLTPILTRKGISF